MEPAARRVPVTLLTGFLGAGKTTLLSRLLEGGHGERLAVLVNEFGDVPIDGRLVVHADEEVVELANGCVCCTVRGDLVRALGGLLARRRRRFRARPFDRLVIETSGLASPGPILQTLAVEPTLARAVEPAGVVTLCNATSVVDELERFPECEEQVGYADLLLLNHCDRAGARELDGAERALAARNRVAPVERVVHGGADPARVLRLAARVPRPAPDAPAHGHTEGAGTVVLRSAAPLELAGLKMWLQFLATKRSHELWRIKGIVRCRERPEAVLVQGVHQYLEIGPAPEEPGADVDSTLVLIGRDLDQAELERGWAACGGAA